MDRLLECAKNYKTLTQSYYKIIIGRKGRTVTIILSFAAEHFHHLLGLHKLTDLSVSNSNRKRVYEHILSGKITFADVEKSSFVDKLDNRLEPLTNLETLLDTNEIIFRYNKNLNSFSLIKADFVLSTPLNCRDTFIFLSHDKNDEYFCRSLFFETNIDYTKGQPKYTLLYKEKVNIHTQISEIQHNRLHTQNSTQ